MLAWVLIFSKKEILSTTNKIIGVTSQDSKLVSKIYSNTILIDKICLEVANGIQPTGDKIFRLDNSIINEYLQLYGHHHLQLKVRIRFLPCVLPYDTWCRVHDG